jgi:imidazoleglycerol phosphate dehydratase HisB
MDMSGSFVTSKWLFPSYWFWLFRQYESASGITRLPHFSEHLDKASAPDSMDLSGEGSEQVTAQVTEQVTGQVSEQVVQVVLASQGEQSRAALMEAVGLGQREHFRESYLVPALAAGYLEMTIPDKPTSARQRYRLTPAGHAFLQTLSQPTP